MLTKERKIEILDTIISGFEKQKTRSINFKDDTCAYLSDDGHKCGIGMLIPQEYYNSLMEGRSIRELIMYKNLCDKNLEIARDKLFEVLNINQRVTIEDVNFYVDLQAIHDNRCVIRDDEHQVKNQESFDYMMDMYKKLRTDIIAGEG